MIFLPILYLLLTLLSLYAQPYWFGFDLLAQFRAQFLAGGAVLAMLMIAWRLVYRNSADKRVAQPVLPANAGEQPSPVSRQRLFAKTTIIMVMVVGLALNAYDYRQIFINQAPLVPPQPDRQIRLLQHNVFVYNTDYAAVKKQIVRENPDIIFFVEATTPLQETLEDLKSLYPYSFPNKGENWNQFFFLSKIPMKSAKIERFKTVPNRLFDATLERDGKEFHFIGIHTPSPTNSTRTRDRNLHFQAIAAYVTGLGNATVILAGDHNCAPFAKAFQGYVNATGLRNTQEQLLPYGSWPAWLPAFLRAAIDNILVSKDIGVVHKRIGEGEGSDHLAVVTDLVLP